MRRSETILAAMVAGGRHCRFDPVQIQHLLFLVDREAGIAIGDSCFGFIPSSHGPLDPDLDGALERLAGDGRIAVEGAGPFVKCRVTGTGRQEGQAALDRMSERASTYIAKAARWVLSRTFWERIAAIHAAYPEMTTDSRALEAVIPSPRTRMRRTLHPFLEGMRMALTFSWGLEALDEPAQASDADKIARDWRAVGDDLRHATEQWAAHPVRQ